MIAAPVASDAPPASDILSYIITYREKRHVLVLGTPTCPSDLIIHSTSRSLACVTTEKMATSVLYVYYALSLCSRSCYRLLVQRSLYFRPSRYKSEVTRVGRNMSMLTTC